MPDATLTYRWSREGYLRAWEAGAFEGRVEYVDGEVIPVVIGSWHGRVTMRLGRLLPDEQAEITAATLPAAGSLPDPDCWVLRAGASPVGQITERVAEWRPEDVLLVVEVSDETVALDLTTKAGLYGAAGYGTYWVVTPEAVYVHTDPTPEGYRVRTELRIGDHVVVPYAEGVLSVEELILG